MKSAPFFLEKESALVAELGSLTDLPDNSLSIKKRFTGLRMKLLVFINLNRSDWKRKSEPKGRIWSQDIVSLINGFGFLKDLLWNAFIEGTRLIKTVEQYKSSFSYFLEEVLTDMIYCNQTNRIKHWEDHWRIKITYAPDKEIQ